MNEQAQEILDMFYDLKNTSGTNAKKEKLCDYIETGFETILALQHVLNTLKPTGIGKKSWNNIEPSDEPEWRVIDYIDWLQHGGHSSHADLALAKSQERYFGELAYILATKDISMGFTANTFNKIAKEFGVKGIPLVSPMLSKNINSLSDKKLDQFLENKAYVTTKLDGIRALAIHNDIEWNIYSRSGKEITGLDHIIDDLNTLLNIQEGRVYDGELIVPSDMTAEDGFRMTAGVVNSKGDKSNVVFNVFDAPRKNDFFGETPVSQRELYTERMFWLDRIRHQNTSVQPIPLLGIVWNQDQLNKLFEESINNGEEGLMLNANSSYVPKRTDQLLKMKQENSVDLRVIDIEEGTGRLTGTTGALVVMYKGNELRVGTGLSDVDRKEFWNDVHGIVGKIIEIGYTTESQDKNGNYSLRFPRFIQVRKDKEEESYD